MIPEGSKHDKNLALDRVDALCRIEPLILSLTEHTHPQTYKRKRQWEQLTGEYVK